MTKKPNARNTKAEILEAYSELLKEKKLLETQAERPSREKPNPVKEMPAVEIRKVTNIAPMNQARIEQTIDGLGRLQQGLASAISELSEKLSLEAEKLEEIQSQVTEETQQLKALHDLEVQDKTLDGLIETYETSAKTFTEEFTQRREALEQNLQDSKKAWEKEQEEYRRSLKERNDEQNKVRQRDLETYKYDLEFRRSQAIDRYEYEKQMQIKELEEFKQVQEKQWAERETAISERENQYAEYKRKVEEYPKELEASIKRGKENGRNIATYQAKVQTDLYAKDIEGQKKVYELRLQSLDETIKNQEIRIQSLSKQLDSALKQVQDLAVKAIEGASNISSSQVLKEIALEQAKQLKSK